MTDAPKIKPYIHRCLIQDGDAAGNTHRVEVGAWGFEFNNHCTNCGEALVTTEQLLAHIYLELSHE